MSSKRAINLARVSTPRQSELYSLDYQLEQMRIYDADVGLTIVAEFKDDVSGRKLERDGLEEACQMLEHNEADVLVTWKFDRLHRNYVNSVLLRDRIRKAGKEIHYAQSRQISGKTARQRLPEDLQYIMAEIEADDILERTQGGMRDKAEKAGKWIGLNRPPYGYNKIGRGQDAAMVIDEWEGMTADQLDRIYKGELLPEVLPLLQAGRALAIVVRLIFVWYVAGDSERKPLSTLAIANRLTALQIPPPEASLPNRKHLKRRAAGEWNRASINKILRQSAYSGTYYHFKWKKIGTSVTINHNKEEWVPVAVPAIVPKVLWDEAQHKIDTGRVFSRRATVNEYLVGRRIRCECGYKMRATPMHHTYTRLDGSTKSYAYSKYVCPGSTKSKTGDVARSCDLPKIRVGEVDEQVWQWVKEDIASPDVLERKLRELQAEQRSEQGDTRATLATLEAHKAEIEGELARLGTLYAKQGMPSRIVDDLIAEQGKKLELTEIEIRKLTLQLETPLTDEDIGSLLLFSVDFGRHLEAVEETFEGRRTVIDGLDVSVEVFRQEKEVWMKMTSILRPEGVSARLFLTP